MPNLTASEESDSEDDEAVMANLIAASQALQRMPNDDSSVYDETQAIDTSSVKGLEIEQPYEHPSSHEEEPPPDPYGMPPLSQWRRNLRR